jgi:hypothetical protein
MLKDSVINKFLQYCKDNKLNPNDYTLNEKLQLTADFIIQDNLKRKCFNDFNEFNDFGIKYCKKNKLDINNLNEEQKFRIAYEFSNKKLDDYFE